MRLRSAFTALLLLAAVSVLAVGPSFVSYGKAWFEGQRGKFGYVDYWIGVDFSKGRIYLSKFVFKEADSVGGSANAKFVGTEWRVVVSAPSARQIAFAMYGYWNGTPAIGTFSLRDGANRGRDIIEFWVHGLFGTPLYSLSGSVVQGDCQIHFSP